MDTENYFLYSISSLLVCSKGIYINYCRKKNEKVTK